MDKLLWSYRKAVQGILDSIKKRGCAHHWHGERIEVEGYPCLERRMATKSTCCKCAKVDIHERRVDHLY